MKPTNLKRALPRSRSGELVSGWLGSWQTLLCKVPIVVSRSDGIVPQLDEGRLGPRNGASDGRRQTAEGGLTPAGSCYRRRTGPNGSSGGARWESYRTKPRTADFPAGNCSREPPRELLRRS